jgi:RES domain-containing protein
LRFQGTAYRAIHPEWSFAPASGEGAAIRGARFNPKNVPALYLATSVEGAFLEATQGLAYKFPPFTMCAFEVDCSDIVDLTTDDRRKSADVHLSEMGAPWALDLARNRKPASWAVYDHLHKDAAGILVPSFANGAASSMANLVLWEWSENLPHKVATHDPDHRLPLNRSSWQDNP